MDEIPLKCECECGCGEVATTSDEGVASARRVQSTPWTLRAGRWCAPVTPASRRSRSVVAQGGRRIATGV